MRRFYKAVDVALTDGGFAVRLDGRVPKSPSGQPLVLPTSPLAELVAADWAAQGENILPDSMLATRLAWGALGVGDDGGRAATVQRMVDFAGSDLVCYFADGPPALVEREERHWGPMLAWAERELGATFHRTQGIVHQPQPDATLAVVERLAEAEDDFALAALAAAAALFGSAIIALAFRRGELTADAAFALSRLDETYQEEKWGVDAEAEKRAVEMAAQAVMLERWFAALGVLRH
jgi:chaperone required for assembly of F1-ATPase